MRCGDQFGDLKTACQDEAKAEQELAKAKAKKGFLMQASSAPNPANRSSGSSGAGNASSSNHVSESGMSSSGSPATHLLPSSDGLAYIHKKSRYQAAVRELQGLAGTD